MTATVANTSPSSAPATPSPAVPPRVLLGAVLLGVVLLGAPAVVRGQSARNVLILIFVYAALAQAWNIVGGLAGQVSFGHAVFFAVGAYTSAALLVKQGLSPWVGAPIGAVLAAVVALVIGYPVFRLGGHYFAIATIAIGEITQTLLINADALGGASGLTLPLVRGAKGQPVDSWYYLQFNENRLPYYYIALVLLALVTGAVIALDRTKPGYYLRAIKNDQEAARSLGIHVTRYKLVAFTISAAFSALAGSFYAQYLLYIDPESTAALSLSILIALVAILGGAGSVWGPAAGAFLLIPLSEFTRSRLGGGGRAVDLVIYGALIVLISMFQPAGLAGIVARLRRRPVTGETALPTVHEEAAAESRPVL